MIEGNQRWELGRDSYRPRGEVIRPSEYGVEKIDELTAKAFIEMHHYSKVFPAARWRFGLFRHGVLTGVSVFSHPVNDRTLTNVFPGRATDSVELGRFVLLDEVPGNGETWFLARVFDVLRHHLVGVVSFSDPVPRTSLDGRMVMPGHIGTIYQAFNGRYIGRGTASTLRLLPDGTNFHKRTIQKIRKLEKGWRSGVAELVRFGADPLVDLDDRFGWLKTWLNRLTRRISHPGNFKYCWALDRRARRHMPEGLPYPKRIIELAS